MIYRQNQQPFEAFFVDLRLVDRTRRFVIVPVLSLDRILTKINVENSDLNPSVMCTSKSET